MRYGWVARSEAWSTLELLVRVSPSRVAEVAVTRPTEPCELLHPLMQLRRLRLLYVAKFGTWSHLAQFLVVGAIGVLVNWAVLYALVGVGVSERFAFAGGIGSGVISNFLLNRRFSFSYARRGSVAKQFVGFVAAYAVGATLAWAVAVWLSARWPEMPLWLASLLGMVVGSGFNFVISRFVVFRAAR